MRVVETVHALRESLLPAERPIGFVPTMGYLHAGHLSLVERARAECRTVVVSIFVNPTQFGPAEDFAAYPRDVPRDLALCENAGVELVFTPPASEMYPPGFSTSVEVAGLQDRWEGASRPGHFRGVATVVARLFRIVQPQRAYFGEKDYQQLQIVKRMAADLAMDVQVVGCPTVRDPDGLAMSSRNAYLDEGARAQALALSAALRAAQQRLAQGERRSPELERAMRDVVAAAPSIQLEYAAIVDPHTLEPVAEVRGEARALIAARVVGVRLIDNAAL